MVRAVRPVSAATWLMRSSRGVVGRVISPPCYHNLDVDVKVVPLELVEDRFRVPGASLLVHDAGHGESATTVWALEDGMGFSRPVLGLALLAVVAVSACQTVGPSAAVDVSSATSGVVARSATPTPVANATEV